MKNESLKLQAYNILMERITNCEYAPGSQLNEELLQNELEMSRTPIRDALSRLEQEGLVTIRPKKGIIVAPLTIKELNMTFELRELLECYSLENYGEAYEEEKLLAYYRFFSSEEAFCEKENYCEDDDFHGMLVAAIPNIYIARSYQQIVNQNTRFRVLTGHRTRQRLEDTSNEHLDIIKACLKRDWPQASQAMRKHLAAAKSASFDLLLEQKYI